jgi:hypothetical protein
VRCKRRNQTFCFLCHSSDTILSLKEKIVDAANQHCGDDPANKISSELLRIMKGDNTILDNDDEEIAKSIQNNDVVNVVLKISDDEYEPVELETSTMDDGDDATPAMAMATS